MLQQLHDSVLQYLQKPLSPTDPDVIVLWVLCLWLLPSTLEYAWREEIKPFLRTLV